jgi:predicted dehydrogenase
MNVVSEKQIRLGIIVSGATGALVANQHLPALLAIRREGGLALADGARVLPDLLLVGRDERKLVGVAQANGIERWSTDLDDALSSREHPLFFDASASGVRFEFVSRAIAASKHVYCEKPIAETLEQAMILVRAAARANIRNGVVQDKIFLPGFRKLGELRASGYFGRILEVRLEFGRWIFDGERSKGQRPSWNYRKRNGGGLVLDMFPHWRYIIEHVAGDIRAVSCTMRTHIPRRIDEQGTPYDVDVEDAAFAQMELAGGVLASVNSSWCTRIRRDDVIAVQIDGTKGSAVAGAYACYAQDQERTPKTAVSVNVRQPRNFFGQWEALPEGDSMNSYRAGWEMFIRHVMDGASFPSPLIAGAKGVQLAELSYRSHRERRWIDVPDLV